MSVPKIVFCDVNEVMIKGWTEFIPKIVENLNYEIYHGTLGERMKGGDIQCVISAANAMGLFTGGVDYYIAQQAFPKKPMELTKLAQDFILEHHTGQVPVGSCSIIEVNDNMPFLGICPTMRSPGTRLDVRSTAPYDCMYSALNAVVQHNKTASKKIDAIMVFGFGTGVGGIPEDHCVKMMALACRHFMMFIDRIKNPPTEAFNSHGFRMQHGDVSAIRREIDYFCSGRF
jgi:O-acetyl-ADP-ribose deacetylase (regulator of RNase III)